MSRQAMLALGFLALPSAVLGFAVHGGAASRAAITAEQPKAAIVFARTTAGNSDIYVRTSTGRVQRLTRGRAYDALPAWSPDRTRIAFVSSRRRGNSEIYVMRADGSGVRRLTTATRAIQDRYPTWSPDGRLIAFSSNRHGVEADIYVMRSDGSGLRRLTRTAGYVADEQPRFSPDGRFIVFTSNRVAYWNYELFRLRASDGRGLKRLTFWGSNQDGAPGDDTMPSYSPDGQSIVFVSDRGGGYSIWTMRPDGKGLREVVRHRGLNHAFPRVSQDGQAVVYTTFPPAQNAGFRLWTARLDGTGRRSLGLGAEADW